MLSREQSWRGGAPQRSVFVPLISGRPNKARRRLIRQLLQNLSSERSARVRGVPSSAGRSRLTGVSVSHGAG